MNVIMTLLVRNEIDKINTNIDYHLSRGIKFFIVTDNGSTDGTIEALEEYEKKGICKIIHELDQDYNQHTWVTRMALMAGKMGATWVINADADELWYPTVEDTFEEEIAKHEGINVLIVGMKTLIPTRVSSEHPGYEYYMNCLHEVRNETYKSIPMTDGLIEVTQGNHRAIMKDQKEKRISGILVYHYPITTWLKFKEKIIQGGSALARNKVLPLNSGSHWRQLYAMLNSESGEEKLRGVWEKRVLPDNEILIKSREGKYEVDTTMVNIIMGGIK